MTGQFFEKNAEFSQREECLSQIVPNESQRLTLIIAHFYKRAICVNHIVRP